VDPKAEAFYGWSGYNSNLDNPILNKDPEGDICIPCLVIVGVGLWLASEPVVAPSRNPESDKVAVDKAWAEHDSQVISNIMPGGRAGGGAVSTALNMAKKAVVKKGKDEVAKAAKGGVYVLKDKDGNVQRSGRTKDLDRRKKEHKRDEETKDLDFEPVHKTDNYAEQRGLEQKVHDDHNPPLNKIEPINPKNPRKEEYKKAAEKHLNNNPK
jgi:hypothetical protein